MENYVWGINSKLVQLMFWSTFLIWCQQVSKQVQYFNYIVNSLLGHIQWLIAIQYDVCITKICWRSLSFGVSWTISTGHRVLNKLCVCVSCARARACVIIDYSWQCPFVNHYRCYRKWVWSDDFIFGIIYFIARSSEQ